jgi:hypothetical protein
VQLPCSQPSGQVVQSSSAAAAAAAADAMIITIEAGRHRASRRAAISGHGRCGRRRESTGGIYHLSSAAVGFAVLIAALVRGRPHSYS